MPQSYPGILTNPDKYLADPGPRPLSFGYESCLATAWPGVLSLP